MQARITRFKMRADSVETARAMMDELKGDILGQPGVRHMLIVMNEDGAGYVIGQIDETGASPEAVDRVRTIWRRFHDLLDDTPDPEIYEVFADWRPDSRRTT
ncbi:hypothetical protein [Amaricoccus sp.]|uniref:hypothetical protein n=1 Tax=Amaricoccus sp. TaxID=1872485 RepID=UPI001B654E1F|nr:hypothetical protein [Amaricoccus sp.]MBP7243288.1 hypothetical protein [Amaricoccus sp.]